MKLHIKLQHLLVDLGMTRAEFAAQMGVSTRTVSNWLNGHVQPTLRMLHKICELCDVSIEELTKLTKKC